MTLQRLTTLVVLCWPARKQQTASADIVATHTVATHNSCALSDDVGTLKLSNDENTPESLLYLNNLMSNWCFRGRGCELVNELEPCLSNTFSVRFVTEILVFFSFSALVHMAQLRANTHSKRMLRTQSTYHNLKCISVIQEHSEIDRQLS